MTNMSIYFLTQEDLIRVTGYRRYGKQREWLLEREIMHTKDRIGRPIVRASDMNNHFDREHQALAS